MFRKPSMSFLRFVFVAFAAFLMVVATAVTGRAQSALDGFNPNANSTVRAMVVQPDGKILVGGVFTLIVGQTRNYIARLNADGTLDTGFNPNADGDVYSIALQSDGKIVVGGFFTNIGGQPRNRIARLDPSTGLADSWNPNANSGGSIFSIAVQSDGKILAGGVFTNIGGQLRNRIARLDGTSGLADTWNPNADNAVYSIALQSDGRVLAGGQFATIGGQPRNLFARLSNDTAALSTLSVTQTTLTLTRDGSAPQFNRVIFEQSINNGATWTLLGTAMNSFAPLIEEGENQFAPNASGYTLTGQNIPTGQNVLIRARGVYRTGYFSGSETTEDKVRNVFLLAPLAANVSISGRVTANGVSVRNAVVRLTTATGTTRTVRTSAFGYYRFDDVEVGETYVVSVNHKRYLFASQVVSVTEDLTELNFTAEP